MHGASFIWQEEPAVVAARPTTRAPDVCGMHMHAHMLDMLRVLSSWTYVRVPDSHGDVDDISDMQDRTRHSSCAGVHAGA